MNFYLSFGATKYHTNFIFLSVNMSRCGICRCDCKAYEVYDRKTSLAMKLVTPKDNYNEEWEEFYVTNKFCKWCFHPKVDHKIQTEG